VFSPPRDHLVGFDVVAFRSEPVLDEEDLRVVVAVLGKDVAAACPGRDDVKGEAEPWAGICETELTVRILEPFAGCARR
jgi:hypothetical protein